MEVGYLVTEVDCLWRGSMVGPAQLDHLVEVGELVVELVAGSLLHGLQEVLLDVLDEGLDAGSELHAPQDVMLEGFEELGEVLEAGSEVHGPHDSVLVVVDVEGSALHGPHGPTALHAPSFSPLLELEELEAGSELHGTQDVMLEELGEVVEAGPELHGPQDVMLEELGEIFAAGSELPAPHDSMLVAVDVDGSEVHGPHGPTALHAPSFPALLKLEEELQAPHATGCCGSAHESPFGTMVYDAGSAVQTATARFEGPAVGFGYTNPDGTGIVDVSISAVTVTSVTVVDVMVVVSGTT